MGPELNRLVSVVPSNEWNTDLLDFYKDLVQTNPAQVTSNLIVRTIITLSTEFFDILNFYVSVCIRSHRYDSPSFVSLRTYIASIPHHGL